MSPRPGQPATARRVAQMVAILAAAIGIRQVIDMTLRASVPSWSTSTMLLVETLVLTGVYGALAWCLVVVPARRRSAPPASSSRRTLTPVTVRAQQGPTLRVVSTSRPRHLSLVPDQPR